MRELSQLYVPVRIKSINHHYRLLTPALFSGILILLYLWTKPGFLGSDDLAYALLAADVGMGEFQLDSHHFTNRFGVFYPTAIFYLIFGVNEYTTTLWPLLSAIILLFAIFLVADKLLDIMTASLALVLIVFNPMLISQISYLLPDLPLGMFIFLAAACLLIARLTGAHRKKLSIILMFCLFVALAILTKETGIWIACFAALVLISDFVKRQHIEMWIWILIGGIVVASIYLLSYYFATGDALFRLEGIETGHNLSFWSYSAGKAGSLIDRLTLGPFTLLVEERGFFLPMALSLPCLISAGAYDKRDHHIARFFAFFGFSIILCFWFGTTSVTAYNPLPLIPRMLTPVVPALAVPSAYVLYQLYFREMQPRSHYILWGATPAFALLGGSAYSYLVLANTPKFYLISAFCLLVPFFVTYTSLPNYERWVRLSGICLLVMIAYFAFSRINKGEFGETPHQRAERSVAEYVLAELPRDATLITSERSAHIIKYYNELNDIKTFRLVIWEENPSLPSEKRAPFYLYFDETRERWLAEAYGDNSFAQFIDNNHIEWQSVRQAESIVLFYSE